MLKVALLAIPIAATDMLGCGRNQPRKLQASTSPEPDALTSANGLESVGFDPQEIDLGQQLWGRTVPVTLMFVNGAERGLRVSEVAASCGCLVLDKDLYKATGIPAHGSLTIEADLEVGLSLGTLRRAVEITTDEGAQFTGVIVAEVVPTYCFSPELVDFGRVGTESAEAGTTAVVAFESDFVQIEGQPVPDCPWLEAEIVPQGEHAREIRLRVLAERLPFDRSVAHVTVYTTDAFVPRRVLQVRATGVQDLAPVPRRVVLMGSAEQIVRFEGADGSEAKLVQVECESEALSIAPRGADTIALRLNSGYTLPDWALVRVKDERGRGGHLSILGVLE